MPSQATVLVPHLALLPESHLSLANLAVPASAGPGAAMAKTLTARRFTHNGPNAIWQSSGLPTWASSNDNRYTLTATLEAINADGMHSNHSQSCPTLCTLLLQRSCTNLIQPCKPQAFPKWHLMLHLTLGNPHLHHFVACSRTPQWKYRDRYHCEMCSSIERLRSLMYNIRECEDIVHDICLPHNMRVSHQYTPEASTEYSTVTCSAS